MNNCIKLYSLNKEQQKYSKKLELTIECTNDTIHFIYNKLNFELDNVPINLDEFSKIITDSLMGKIMDADLMYSKSIEILSEKLNPFDIGIVVNKHMEMWLDKKIDKLQMMNSYSEFCKITENRKVSVEEYRKNVWEK